MLTASRPISRWPFVVVSGALFVILFASNLATPLYAVYRHRFGFSATELTLIFATYAVVLVPSLLIFGQLSDRVGRRRVILIGLSGAALSLVLFAIARSTTWLYVARAVQGLATGITTAGAAAALVELEPDGRRDRAARALVLANNGGAAAGPLIAGLLAQWAPAPRVLCYLVGLGAVLLAMASVLRIPEPVTPNGGWRVALPSVPVAVRGRFARAALTGAAIWATGALFLSVVPSYASSLLRSSNLALLGAITALMLATSCCTQGLAQRVGLQAKYTQPTGLILLVAGVLALVFALPLHSMAAVLIAAVLAGAGLGIAFFGAETDINQLAPSERRGEVTAAFLTCVYAGVAISTITTGLLSDAYSLATAVAVTGAAVTTVATATALWHLATNRRSRSASLSP